MSRIGHGVIGLATIVAQGVLMHNILKLWMINDKAMPFLEFISNKRLCLKNMPKKSKIKH